MENLSFIELAAKDLVDMYFIFITVTVHVSVINAPGFQPGLAAPPGGAAFLRMPEEPQPLKSRKLK